MGLNNIEVMRAHRTKINQRVAKANGPQPRPIHVYLLRYTDKGRILKAAASTLKDKILSVIVKYSSRTTYQTLFARIEQSYERTI